MPAPTGSTDVCPRCTATLAAIDSHLPWCVQCEWNLDTAEPDEHSGWLIRTVAAADLRAAFRADRALTRTAITEESPDRALHLGMHVIGAAGQRRTEVRADLLAARAAGSAGALGLFDALALVPQLARSLQPIDGTRGALAVRLGVGASVVLTEAESAAIDTEIGPYVEALRRRISEVYEL